MNESEKRRRELLRSAREMYGDSHMPPAQVDSEEVVQMVEQDANTIESWSDLIIK